jgi:hypothetical protein
MFTATPATQLSGSFGHGNPTHSRGAVIAREANAVVLDFKGETAVHMTYPDNNPPGPGMPHRVANRFLSNAVGRNLYRCRKYRGVTRNLEGNRWGALHTHHSAEFRVLLKGSQQAFIV